MNVSALYLPIAKIDREQRMAFGYASTPTLDLDGEIVEADAIKAALPDYMEWRNVRAMHQPIAVGTTKEANVDDKGLYIGAKIVDDDAWKKVTSGVYQGFSIGGDVTRRDGNKITGLKLIEISLVDRPANPDCRIDVIKAAGISEDEGMADLSAGERLVPPDPGEVGWLRRMVEKLAGSERVEKERGVPGSGKEPHGDVAYADPGWQKDKVKRYPIDTEEHIRAAWNYIHQARNAAKYSPAHLKTIKDRIVAAWKSKIDPKGPPEAKAAEPDEEGGKAIEKEDPFMSEDVDDGDEAPAAHDGFSLPAKKAAGRAFAAALSGSLNKGMSAVQMLACVTDTLDCAERCLREDAADEHGDPNDSELADCVCTTRSMLLDVIAQKAMHEKKEREETAEDNEDITVDLSGADKMADSPLTKRAATGRHHDHLRRAHHHVSEAARMLEKIAHAKNGRFEADKAARASLMKAAADDMERMGDHLALAVHHIRAAAGEDAEAPFEADRNGDTPRGEPRDEHVYEPERGIEGVGQREMTEGSVSDYEAGEPYPGKAARAGSISKREADAIAEAAYLKGKLEAIEKTPATPRARLFAVPRGAFPVGREEETSATEKLLNGVDLDAPDQGGRRRAAGKMLSNMIANPRTFARPVVGDATFKGAAAR